MTSFRKRKDIIYSEYEVPSETVISEGDELIKNLVDKQLNKNISLENELNRVKQFDPPTVLINETQFLSGNNNLQQFKNQTELLQILQQLKSAELTEDETELYLDYQKGEEYLKNKHKNICSQILQQKLKDIFNKLQKKQNNSDTNFKNRCVSRHITEIALSTKPESLETKLYKFATSNLSKNDIVQKNHPINNLHSLERDLFQHLDGPQIPSLKKRRKKAKKYLETENELISINSENISIKNQPETKWDLKKLPEIQYEEKNIENKPTKIYTCSSQRKYTIVNKQIVQIYSPSTSNSENTKQLNGKQFVAGKTIENTETFDKLTEEEIRKIPKFKNYEKGSPSKVLFIKNLAKQTNEADLIKLFNCFDNENNRITYRLLTGKMKGQAFITFNSVDEATRALETVNGTVMKNKPLVIQYGKSI